MTVSFETSPAEAITADALAVLCFEKEEGRTLNDPPVAAQDGWLTELRETGEFTGKLFEVAVLHRPAGLAAKRLVVAGAGKRSKFSAVEARRVSGALARSLRPKGMRTIAVALDDGQTVELVQAFAEGAVLGAWEPDKYKTDAAKNEKAIERFVLVGTPEVQAAAEQGRTIAEAQNFARDLVNEPANQLTPELLAAAAKKMAGSEGLTFDVLDREAMSRLGMGALLGVAQGSLNPPYLLVVGYRPAEARWSDHLALVGKGVTFDTGGVSIKPSEGMEKMKYDMAGAAAVLGGMQAIARLKPALAVSAFVPTVENMVSGNAQRPGDIVKTLSGKTVEVLNTDAEGRLILADAITYARRQGATHLVDAATLTGAIGIALGHYNMGAFTNDQPFLDRFLAASRAAGEKTWQLPLDEEYKEYLKSAFADLPNIGGRYGGSITAAWFLREFADPTPWVHLDIASTAWLDDAKPYLAKGPSGVGVRSFVELAMRWAN